MKKTKILSFVSLPMVMAMLASCGHEHTFDEKWSHDEKEHWHAATCEHYGEKADLAPHEFGDDTICDVCGYDVANPTPTPHEHDFKGDYQKDETNHWQVCECGEAGPKEAHTMVEGVCSVCGYEQGVIPPSPGGNYEVTEERWNQIFGHEQYKYLFAENYYASVNIDVKLNGEVQGTQYAKITADGNKLKVERDSKLLYYSFEDGQLYYYNLISGDNWDKSACDESYGYSEVSVYFEPFGAGFSNFTYDSVSKSYKAETIILEQGPNSVTFSNVEVNFLDNNIVGASFSSPNPANKDIIAEMKATFTLGGQVVDLPEVSPPVTEPVYGYTLDGGSTFTDLIAGMDPSENPQYSVENVPLLAGESIGFANTAPEIPEYMTPLSFEDGSYTSFNEEGGVLTAIEDGVYSFYLKIRGFEDNVIYIVKNDAPTKYQILLGDVAVNLLHNETPQDPSFDEWFVTGLSIEEGTQILVRNNDTLTDFHISLDPASVAGCFSDDYEKITCEQSGVYDLYLKIKYGEDQIYIGASAL